MRINTKKYFINKDIFVYFLLCLIVFFISNQFDLTHFEEDKVRNKILPHEDGWVIGTTLRTRQNGLFSTNVFTTRYLPNKYKGEKNILKASEIYQVDLIDNSKKIDEPGTWNTYYSALRLPVSIYAIIDHLYYKFTGSYKNLLPHFKTANNFFTSIAFSLLILWIYFEFGLQISVLSFILLLFNPITINSIIMSPIWIRFIPLLSLLIFIQRWKGFYNRRYFTYLFAISFFAIAACQTLQYEMTSIILISGTLPIFYYAIKNKWSNNLFIKNLAIYGAAGTLAIIFILFLHYFLLSKYLNSFDAAFDHFSGKFIQRTYVELENTGIGEAHKSTRGHSVALFDVIKRYSLQQDVYLGFSAWEIMKINILLYLVLLISIWKIPYFRIDKRKRKLLSYALMPAIALIATLSYFVIFKSQAADHNFAWSYWNYFYTPTLAIFFSILMIFFIDIGSKTLKNKG